MRTTTSRHRSLRWKLASIATSLIVAASLSPQSTNACTGTPRAPFCGKTLVVSMASNEWLLTAGGSVDLPSLLYVSVGDVPVGSGLCPPGPYAVDIGVTSVCDTGGAGTGGVPGTPVVNGFFDLDVPFVLPAGPPRLCTLTGTATATLSDGMVLTATADTVLCVGDPAPGDPSLPRLSLELIGDPSLAVQRVHPGDQAAYRYLLTNNDPVEAFTGSLEVVSTNLSRLPGASGPMPPGTGVFSVSDPSQGDHFPIAFADALAGSCVPLPPNPLALPEPTLLEPITLLPGQSIEKEVWVRPWGMCANGSCGRTRLVLDGSFADTSRGIACAGVVTAADSAAPPSFAWPDGGQTVQFPPPPAPDQGFLIMDAQPTESVAALVDLIMPPPQIQIDGLPLPGQLQPLFVPMDPDSARAQFQFQPQTPFPIDSFFDIAYQVQIQPDPNGPPIATEMLQVHLEDAGPTGFENLAPFGIGEIGVRLPQTPPGLFDGFIQLMPQISGVGVDDQGSHRVLQFDQVEFLLLPAGQGFEIRLAGTFGPGAGSLIEALELRLDFRAFALEAARFIFGDGFESGDVSVWSSAN